LIIVIRKILLFFITLYIILWLAGAHLLKSGVIMSINKIQTDNFNLNYQYVNISGFPFQWKIRITSPKIILIDQISSRELSADYIDCVFSYGLKKVTMNFGQLWNYQDGFSEQQKISLVSSKDLIIDLDFENHISITSPSGLFSSNVSSLSLESNEVSGLYDNDEFFKLISTEIIATKSLEENNIDNWKVTGQIDYNGKDGALIASNASFVIALNYKINNLSEEEKPEGMNFDHMLDLENFKFSLGTSSLEMRGSLKLNQTSLPQGQFMASMTQYGQLIDQVIPDGFFISRPQAKKMIAKVSGVDWTNQDTLDKKSNFKIFFSDDGFSLGN